MKQFFVIVALVCVWALNPAELRAEPPAFALAIKDHKFIPEKLEIPAEQKVKIVIENQDATPEEFESYDLHREKVVSGHGKIIVFIGPLKAGIYKFFGEFHQGTAQGAVIAK